MVPAPLVLATQPDGRPQQRNPEDMEFNSSPTHNVSMPLLCHCLCPSASSPWSNPAHTNSALEQLGPTLVSEVVHSITESHNSQGWKGPLVQSPLVPTELQCSGCPLLNHCSGFSGDLHPSPCSQLDPLPSHPLIPQAQCPKPALMPQPRAGGACTLQDTRGS